MRLFYSLRKDMKSQKVFLVFLVLFINCQVLIAQEKNENLILFDSFSEANYEDLAARIDSLTFEKNKTPNAVGYIVIYGGSNPIENAFYKKAIVRYVKFRGSDEQKLKIITSTDSKKIKFEFWVSKDGTQPKVRQENISLILPKTNEAIYFTDGLIEITEIQGKQTYLSVGCDAGCITQLDFYLLSEFLKANLRLNAFVIIHNKNLEKAKSVKNVLFKDILNDTEISSGQLNFLYGGKNKINNNRFSEVEVYLAIDKTQLPKLSSTKYKRL